MYRHYLLFELLSNKKAVDESTPQLLLFIDTIAVLRGGKHNPQLEELL